MLRVLAGFLLLANATVAFWEERQAYMAAVGSFLGRHD